MKEDEELYSREKSSRCFVWLAGLFGALKTISKQAGASISRLRAHFLLQHYRVLLTGQTRVNLFSGTS